MSIDLTYGIHHQQQKQDQFQESWLVHHVCLAAGYLSCKTSNQNSTAGAFNVNVFAFLDRMVKSLSKKFCPTNLKLTTEQTSNMCNSVSPWHQYLLMLILLWWLWQREGMSQTLYRGTRAGMRGNLGGVGQRQREKEREKTGLSSLL